MNKSFKISIDTIIIIFAMVSPVAPLIYAKKLVLVSISLLTFRLIIYNNLFYNFIKKLFIFIFFIPGIILTSFNASENLIRFFPILFIIFLYPFSKLRLNFNSIKVTSVLILFYLISTQVLLTYSFQQLFDFRNYYYPNEFTEMWDNSYPIQDISLFEKIGNYRAAGLFYNPNVMGTVVVLYFFFFIYCANNVEDFRVLLKKKTIINNLFFSIFLIFIILSLYFTLSRTAILGFIGFLFIKYLNFNNFKFKYFFFLFLLSFFSIYFLHEHMIEGFLDGGSLNIKFKIIIDYLSYVPDLNLYLGGIYSHKTYDLQFDQDLGNWLGSVGLFGIVGLIIIFKLLFNIVNLRPLVVSILLLSVGGGALFGIFTASIILPLIVVACSRQHQV
jgi:hypothetical protein